MQLVLAGVRHLALWDRPCGLPARAKCDLGPQSGASFSKLPACEFDRYQLELTTQYANIPLVGPRPQSSARAPSRVLVAPEVRRTLPGLSSSRRRPGGLSSSAARRAMSATGRENLREHLLERDVEECAT